MGIPSIGGVGAQVMSPGTAQTVQSTGSDALAAALGGTTRVVRLCADGTGFYAKNAAATTTTGTRLPADFVEYIETNGGDVIHWISSSGTTNLNITPVS